MGTQRLSMTTTKTTSTMTSTSMRLAPGFAFQLEKVVLGGRDDDWAQWAIGNTIEIIFRAAVSASGHSISSQRIGAHTNSDVGWCCGDEIDWQIIFPHRKRRISEFPPPMTPHHSFTGGEFPRFPRRRLGSVYPRPLPLLCESLSTFCPMHGLPNTTT